MNRTWRCAAFFFPLIFVPIVVFADHKCRKCHREYGGEVVRKELKLENGARISLEYDGEPLGIGSYTTEVFHAVMQKYNARGEMVIGEKCVAYKLTPLIGDDMENAKRMHKNEWEKLAIFDEMEENRRKHVIKMHGKGTFVEDGIEFYFTLLELGTITFTKHILAKHHEWGEKELTDEMVATEIGHVVMPLREIHQKLIHMDIKSQNLLLVDGIWKAIDLGVAESVPDAHKTHPDANAPIFVDEPTLTTFIIAAPENGIEQNDPQNGRGQFRYTTKNDIWAVGVLLLQICSHKFVPRKTTRLDAELDLDLKTDELRKKYWHIERTKGEWADYIARDWQSSLKYFTFILGIRKCCPRTFHLITATLNPDPMLRPTANGILSFLDNKCRFDSQKEGGEKRAFLPGLSLHELRAMLAKKEEIFSEARELIALANWEEGGSSSRAIPQEDCDRNTNGFGAAYVFAKHKCRKCHREYGGELMKKNLVLDGYGPMMGQISLEYDGEPLGEGGYSKVFHAIVTRINSKGEFVVAKKCVAYKVTELRGDLARRESAKKQHKNEWEKLAIFDQMEENRRMHVIKMHGKGTFVEDGIEFYFTLLELGTITFTKHILAKHDQWTSQGEELTDEMVATEIGHVVMPLRDIHQKVIHMDIKSQNFLLVDGIWKAIDLGVAESIPDAHKTHPDANAPIFMDEPTLTTFIIAAPDHSIRQKDPHDGHKKYRYTTKNDIWSLGVTLLQICSHKFVWSPSPEDQRRVSPERSREFDFDWKTDSLRMKYWDYLETKKGWTKYISEKPERALNFFTFILGIRKCCPRTFHLITATLNPDPISRPTANGILSFLDNKCRFDSQKEGGEKRAFLPGLSLHELRKMLNNVLKEQEAEANRNKFADHLRRKVEEWNGLVELANWEEASTSRPVVHQDDCDTNGIGAERKKSILGKMRKKLTNLVGRP